MYFLLLLITSLLQFSLQQSCSTRSDVGGTECISISRYIGYQWATCLTDDYVMRASNRKHQCIDRTALYCWYQCMLEIHDLNTGTVTRDCQCTPNANAMTTEPPTDILPPECYSPRGDNCNWYRNCLEVRYPCQHTPDGYAIEYAEKFCKLYSDHLTDFTYNGRRWIDGVRKCLQVSMVPFMRPWVVKTCADIKQEAFNSHPNCYLRPDVGVPGICSLPPKDVMRSFWLVNFVGGAFSEAPIETGSQMFCVIKGCLKQWPSNVLDAIETRILYFNLSSQLEDNILDALSVVNYVAKKQKWLKYGFRWLMLIELIDRSVNCNLDANMHNRNKRQVSSGTIAVLLADAKVLDIGEDIQGGQNLERALIAFSNSVTLGEFSKIPISSSKTLELVEVAMCSELTCDENNATVIATAAITNKGSFIKMNFIYIFTCLFVVNWC